MSMIALKIPSDISEKLSKIKVDGKKELPQEYHITMFYFDGKLKIDDICKITRIMNSVLGRFVPPKISFKEVSFFPKGNDGFPVIVPILSDDLIEVRKSLVKAFDKEKINYSKKWPEFKPHLTLAYSKKEPTNQNIGKCSWNATELVLYAGDKFEFSKFENGMFIFMPFGKKASSKFEMIRLASFVFEVEQLNSLI
mgnify:CR=1 FL=1